MSLQGIVQHITGKFQVLNTFRGNKWTDTRTSRHWSCFLAWVIVEGLCPCVRSVQADGFVILKCQSPLRDRNFCHYGITIAATVKVPVCPRCTSVNYRLGNFWCTVKMKVFVARGRKLIESSRRGLLWLFSIVKMNCYKRRCITLWPAHGDIVFRFLPHVFSHDYSALLQFVQIESLNSSSCAFILSNESWGPKTHQTTWWFYTGWLNKDAHFGIYIHLRSSSRCNRDKFGLFWRGCHVDGSSITLLLDFPEPHVYAINHVVRQHTKKLTRLSGGQGVKGSGGGVLVQHLNPATV